MKTLEDLIKENSVTEHMHISSGTWDYRTMIDISHLATAIRSHYKGLVGEADEHSEYCSGVALGDDSCDCGTEVANKTRAEMRDKIEKDT